MGNALIFDYVFMVEILQDVDLSGEVVALLFSVLGLQRLHSHHLARSVPPRVVAA